MDHEQVNPTMKLEDQGIKGLGAVYYNYDAAALHDAAIDAGELNEGIGLISLIVKAGFETSNGKARRLIEGGGVRIHDTKITDPTHTVTANDIIDGYVLVRAGKKRLFRFDVR